MSDATPYELNMTRVFDAPRELVWKAWTDPEMAAHWVGPRGFRTTEFVARNAGEPWHLLMEGRRPGSDVLVQMGQRGTTLEVRPPELLRYTFAWDDRSSVGLGDSPIKENIVTVRLEERGRKTVLHFTQGPFATEAERDGHKGGWNSAFDKFAEFMNAEQPGRVADPDEVPTELHLKRFFAAPRELVFNAWIDPLIVAQWWGPKYFTSTVEKWEARAGGEIYVVMHGPEGASHPMNGKFFQVFPPYQFHFSAAALDKEGNAMFENWNSVFFEEVEGGTQIILDIHVINQTDVAPMYLKGMTAGWTTSLEKLAALVEG